tara:strand:+ start:339 stop:611 length:273 start_codon:yes stop_codon:yes gene_type:complete
MRNKIIAITLMFLVMSSSYTQLPVPQSKERKKVNTIIFFTTIILTTATIPFSMFPIIPFTVFSTGIIILSKRKNTIGKKATRELNKPIEI